MLPSYRIRSVKHFATNLDRLLSSCRDAMTVVDAALDETEKWEQGLLLRTKAKLQIAKGKLMQAMETYKLLLTLIQTQRKSVGKTDAKRKTRNDKTSEVSVWQDLAAVYITLSQCHDAEICLEKAHALNPLSAVTWNSYGGLCESRQQIEEALNAYGNALILDPENVQAKVSMGAFAQHWKRLSACSKKLFEGCPSFGTRKLCCLVSSWYCS